MAVDMLQVLQYANKYTTVELRGLIRESQNKIAQYEKDRREIEADESWDEFRKELHLKSLNERVEAEQKLIVVFLAAIRVLEHQEKTGAFDPAEMEIDGLLATEK